MTKLHNRAGLPESIARAVSNDGYDSGRPKDVDPSRYFTTTTLVAPTRQVHLKRRHADEIEEDVSDRIWSLLGQSVHTILERAGATGYERILAAGRMVRSLEREERARDEPSIPRLNAFPDALFGLRNLANWYVDEAREHHILTEKRLYMTISMKVDASKGEIGVTIGGAFDHLDLRDGILSDYKVTSVWSAKEGAKDEWVCQNNVNALLCEENGYSVQKTQNIVIYRDWSVAEAARDPSYPQTQVATIETPKWSKETTLAWIRGRLEKLLAAEDLPDDALPECSEDERWARGSAWVVVKAGNTKATPKSKRETKEEAEELARQLEQESIAKKKPARYLPEFRPAESKRCKLFCSAVDFCSQGKAILAADAARNTEEAA